MTSMTGGHAASGATLGGAVRNLLSRAIDTYSDSPQAAGWLRMHLTRFDEPLRVAIAGKVKAGKSTLLNALVGEEIAPTDAGECTRIVTWYQDAPSPKVLMYSKGGGAPRQLSIHRNDGALAFDLAGTPTERVDRLVVDWPSQSLRGTTLIDTPGIDSLSTDVSARSHQFLAPEDEPTAADAVVYLMRHLHSGDVRFLESFHDQGVARATAVNTIAVLSRADEIGVGRLDALMSAKRIASRYRSDDKLRDLCQTVVAVAGLLAQTGRTLRQAEFAALTELSTLERDDMDTLLLSADRFVKSDTTANLSTEARGALLERFGLFGVRLSRRSCPPSWSAAPASTTCARCSTSSSPSAATCSRPGPRCSRSTWCCAASRSRPRSRWPSSSNGSWTARTSSPSCGCSPRCAPVRSRCRRTRASRRSGCSAATAVPCPPGSASTRWPTPVRRARRPWTRSAGGAGARRTRCPHARWRTPPAS
jgi:hypothetical protein